jgi:hypothetical protein
MCHWQLNLKIVSGCYVGQDNIDVLVLAGELAVPLALVVRLLELEAVDGVAAEVAAETEAEEIVVEIIAVVEATVVAAVTEEEALSKEGLKISKKTL